MLSDSVLLNVIDKRVLPVYHIGWVNDGVEKIVNEQLRLCAYYGITDINVTMSGDPDKDEIVDMLCHHHNIRWCLVDADDDIHAFEKPAMRFIERQHHRSDFVLYLHTKGATLAQRPHHPEYTKKVIWRRLMMREVLGNHRSLVANMTKNPSLMAAGCNWMHCRNQHFSGNFWLARSSYIDTLKPFDEWWDEYGKQKVDKEKTQRRLACEFWIGQCGRRLQAGCDILTLPYSTEHDIPYWQKGVLEHKYKQYAPH